MEHIPTTKKPEVAPTPEEAKKGEVLTQETGETTVFIDDQGHTRYIDVENG